MLAVDDPWMMSVAAGKADVAPTNSVRIAAAPNQRDALRRSVTNMATTFPTIAVTLCMREGATKSCNLAVPARRLDSNRVLKPTSLGTSVESRSL